MFLSIATTQWPAARRSAPRRAAPWCLPSCPPKRNGESLTRLASLPPPPPPFLRAARRYLYDHRNASVSDFIVNELLGPSLMGNANLSGAYLDDEWYNTTM